MTKKEIKLDSQIQKAAKDTIKAGKVISYPIAGYKGYKGYKGLERLRGANKTT